MGSGIKSHNFPCMAPGGSDVKKQRKSSAFFSVNDKPKETRGYGQVWKGELFFAVFLFSGENICEIELRLS